MSYRNLSMMLKLIIIKTTITIKRHTFWHPCQNKLRDFRNTLAAQKFSETSKKIALFKRSLNIILFLLAVLSISYPIKACPGRFVNPVTDICWSCLFPISIGPGKVFKKVKLNED